MNRINSFGEARAIWAAGKNPGNRSLTNLFLPQESLERCARNGRLNGVSEPGASLLLRRDRDFQHVYVNYSDTEILESLLKQIPASETLVVDVVQRNNSHDQLIQVLSDCGFSPHRHLIRLNRPALPLGETGYREHVEIALEQDADLILSKLEAHFDRFSEQLPDLDEIVEAISRSELIISRVEGKIAGFLFLEVNGNASRLRYWFVDPEFRDRSIGSSLLRHYLSVPAKSLSSQLWVVSDNTTAIAKYQHYGYSPDVLEDHVMLRRLEE